ncbi:hypothetical protein [Thermococcus sp.]|uniref:hypothetical protein n=1 Tax=Thermococcus sp. TaxID=35749 RepID=UPI002627ED59|nr:hypothetical protein [Thermococcus sp.]
MLIDMKTLSVLMEIRSRRGGKKDLPRRCSAYWKGSYPRGMTSVELLREMREEYDWGIH